jgi:uncharacterized protein (DUF1330 family)
MPAYLIVTRNGPITDQEAYGMYMQKNQENPAKVPLKPLVAYGELTPLEGEAPEGVVMLEFENADLARAWYNSPEYQAALPYRLKCGDWSAFIVDGAMNLPA